MTDRPTVEAGWILAPSGAKLFRIDKNGFWVYDKKRKAELCLTFAELLRIIASNLNE